MAIGNGEFVEEQGRGEDEDEDVAGDVVATPPATPGGLAHGARGDGGHVDGLLQAVGVHDVGFTVTSGDGEAPVDECRAEEPLRRQDPGQRREAVSQRHLGVMLASEGWGRSGGEL